MTGAVASVLSFFNASNDLPSSGSRPGTHRKNDDAHGVDVRGRADALRALELLRRHVAHAPDELIGARAARPRHRDFVQAGDAEADDLHDGVGLRLVRWARKERKMFAGLMSRWMTLALWALDAGDK
jgi:hypothetical protein